MSASAGRRVSPAFLGAYSPPRRFPQISKEASGEDGGIFLQVQGDATVLSAVTTGHALAQALTCRCYESVPALPRGSRVF